jgi:hypothetical protein
MKGGFGRRFAGELGGAGFSESGISASRFPVNVSPVF